MIKVVGFLQNAWSPMYAGSTWPRASWLYALMTCRSGQKLRVLTSECNEVEFWWDNTTPVVGEAPNSILPPDSDHIRSVLHVQEPDIVLTLGRHAANAVQPLWNGPLLILPHPAYRVVTNALYAQAGKYLRNNMKPGEVVEVKQARGQVIFLKDNDNGKSSSSAHGRHTSSTKVVGQTSRSRR